MQCRASVSPRVVPLARANPAPSLPLPPPPPLDGNDDDTRLINYPRRGFKWRPPPKGDGGPF